MQDDTIKTVLKFQETSIFLQKLTLTVLLKTEGEYYYFSIIY